MLRAVIAQLVARRSHNPKVVISILTRRIARDGPQLIASSSAIPHTTVLLGKDCQPRRACRAEDITRAYEACDKGGAPALAWGSPCHMTSAAIAQLVARRSHNLVARRSHNPKVVSSILTRRIEH